MKDILLNLALLLLIGCNSSITHQKGLVVENLKFFRFFDSECESWLESKFPCATDSCFSSSAVEIVGIDTSESSQYQIYAWAWNEHFILRSKKAYSGEKNLIIARFTVDPRSRANHITEVFLADPELPIQAQLEEQGFPSSLINTYFAHQPESTERARIKALAQKATTKYNLFLDKAYISRDDVIKDTIESSDTLSE